MYLRNALLKALLEYYVFLIDHAYVNELVLDFICFYHSM